MLTVCAILCMTEHEVTVLHLIMFQAFLGTNPNLFGRNYTIALCYYTNV